MNSWCNPGFVTSFSAAKAGSAHQCRSCAPQIPRIGSSAHVSQPNTLKKLNSKWLNPKVLNRKLFEQLPDQSGSNNRGCTVEIHCTNACLHPYAFPVGNNAVYTQTVAA